MDGHYLIGFQHPGLIQDDLFTLDKVNVVVFCIPLFESTELPIPLCTAHNHYVVDSKSVVVISNMSTLSSTLWRSHLEQVTSF